MRQSGKKQGMLVALAASAVVWGGCGPQEESLLGAEEVVAESSGEQAEPGQVNALSVYRSCRALKNAVPSAASGRYTIDVDGSGPMGSFYAYCDMSFDGGGWTLIFANGTGAPYGMDSGAVMPNSGKYMPNARIKELSINSSQVHIRSAGNTSRSITSLSGNAVIGKLRNLQILNTGTADSPGIGNWTGPLATRQYLDYDCAPMESSYPHIYHACLNGSGLHLVHTYATWDWDTPNELMEVYVR